MADPHAPAVDLTLSKSPEVSPTLATHFRPILEQIQTLLCSFSHPDATTTSFPSCNTPPKDAGNINAQPSIPFSEGLLTCTHHAETALHSPAPQSPERLGLRTSGDKLQLKPPTSDLAAHGNSTGNANPILGSEDFSTALPRAPLPFDLDPYATVDDLPQLSAAGHVLHQTPTHEENQNIAGDNSGISDIKHLNDGENKKSFLSVLCGAPEVVDAVNCEAPYMVGNNPLVRIDEEAYLGSLAKCSTQLLSKLTLMQGEKPYTAKDLKSKLDNIWHPKHSWKLIPIGRGFFCLCFESKDDQNLIWSRGSVSLKPGVLRITKWEIDLNPFNQKNVTAQLWVTFLNLPIEYWHFKILLSLARAIGIPIRIDQATLNLDFGYYARVLIDVDMSHPLPDHVVIQREGFSFPVVLDFERVPLQCSHCGFLGHSLNECRQIKAAQQKPPQAHSQPNQWQTKKHKHSSKLPRQNSNQPAHPSLASGQPKDAPDICPPSTQTQPPAQNFNIFHAHALYNNPNPLANPPAASPTLQAQPSPSALPLPQAAPSPSQPRPPSHVSDPKYDHPSPPSLDAAPDTSPHPLAISIHAQHISQSPHPAAQTAASPADRELISLANNNFVLEEIVDFGQNQVVSPVHSTFVVLEEFDPDISHDFHSKYLQNSDSNGKTVASPGPVVQQVLDLGHDKNLPSPVVAAQGSKTAVQTPQTAASSSTGARATLSASAVAFSPSAPSSFKEALQQSPSVHGASPKEKQPSSLATHNSFAALDTDRIDALDKGCLDSMSSSLVHEVEARYRDDRSSSSSSLSSFPITLSSAQKKKLKLQKAKMREDEIQRVIAFASGTPMPDESVDTMDLSLAEFSKKFLKPSKMKIKKPPIRIR